MLAKLVVDGAVEVAQEDREGLLVKKPKGGNVSNWKYVLRCDAWNKVEHMCWCFIPWNFPGEHSLDHYVDLSYHIDEATSLPVVTNASIKREFLDSGDLSWLPTTLEGGKRDHRYLKDAAAAMFGSPAAIDVRSGLVKAFKDFLS